MSGILNIDDASDGGVQRRPSAVASPPPSGDEMSGEGMSAVESTLETIRNSHGNDSSNTNSGAVENPEEKKDETDVGDKGHGQAARGRQGAGVGSRTDEGTPSPFPSRTPNPLELPPNRQDRHVSRAWSASPSSANFLRRHRIAHSLERRHDPLAFRVDGSVGGRDNEGSRSGLVSGEGDAGNDASPVLSRSGVDSSGESSAQQQRGAGERSGGDVDELNRGFGNNSNNIRHRETPLSCRNRIEGKRTIESGSTRAEILGSDGANEALWDIGVAADNASPLQIQDRKRRYVFKHLYIIVIWGGGTVLNFQKSIPWLQSGNPLGIKRGGHADGMRSSNTPIYPRYTRGGGGMKQSVYPVFGGGFSPLRVKFCRPNS